MMCVGEQWSWFQLTLRQNSEIWNRAVQKAWLCGPIPDGPYRIRLYIMCKLKFGKLYFPIPSMDRFFDIIWYFNLTKQTRRYILEILQCKVWNSTARVWRIFVTCLGLVFRRGQVLGPSTLNGELVEKVWTPTEYDRIGICTCKIDSEIGIRILQISGSRPETWTNS